MAEITAFITALRAGDVAAPADGVTPKLTESQVRGGGVARVADDTVAAFCMTAALSGDKAAVDTVEAGLLARYGSDFPGSHGLSYFRMVNEAPVTLDDFVGQAGKTMLAGDIPPPPLRAKDNWSTGLRFFERARKSNFVREIIHPLARWHRARWAETAEQGVAFLQHIEDAVPVLRQALEDPRHDEPFIANLLLKAAPFVDMELTDDAAGFLRSLARR